MGCKRCLFFFGEDIFFFWKNELTIRKMYAMLCTSTIIFFTVVKGGAGYE